MTNEAKPCARCGRHRKRREALASRSKFCIGCRGLRRPCGVCQVRHFPADGPCPNCSGDAIAAVYDPEEFQRVRRRIRLSRALVAAALG